MICARGGRKPCMSIGLHRHNLVDGDVGRQELVEAASPRAGRIKGGFRVEVCHHQTGVHSSVCPSCSRHFDGFAQQGGECLAEHLLHTDTVGLNLPTVIACTIVRKINKEPHGN